MTTATDHDPDLDRDEVVIALRREAGELTVQPSPIRRVADAGHRRRVRRRTAAGTVGVAAALAGALGIASLVDGPADRVRTVDAPEPVPTGPSLEPLLVESNAPTPPGVAVPEGFSGPLDVLTADGERQAWSRWGDDPQWAVSDGIVLADGRRVAIAYGRTGGPNEGEVALVELDGRGLVEAVHPLAIAALDGWSTWLRIIGAEGTVVDLAVERERELGDGDIAPGTRIEMTTEVIAVDLATAEVDQVIDGLDQYDVRTAGGRVVVSDRVVGAGVPCEITVRDRIDLDRARIVTVPCERDPSYPAQIQLQAIDPTGRWAAVVRTLLTTGMPDVTLLVVDLDDGTTTEVVTVPGAMPWRDMAWGDDGALLVAMVADSPEVPAIDIPSPAGVPEIRVVRYTER